MHKFFDLLIGVVTRSKFLTECVLFISRFILDKHRCAFLKWKLDRGDETLRINYPLTKKSIVFDLGGYRGEWALPIYNRYQSNLYIFEPVPAFATAIKRIFAQRARVHVFPFGLAGKSAEIDLHMAENASSEFGNSGRVVRVKLKNVKRFLKEKKITNVDLVKLNIEGGEYELLEYMIKVNLVKMFDNIQVQFHTHVENADKRANWIRKKLSQTHELTYQYLFVWENWKRK